MLTECGWIRRKAGKINRSRRAYLYPILLLPFLSCTEGCRKEDNPGEAGPPKPVQSQISQEIIIPKQGEWVDRGLILEKGKKGDWDYYMYGGFTGTAIKRDGVYFLYYQGARDYSEKYGTVTYRSIGVATSNDGLNFTKYAHNPVIKWFPNNGIEEGAASGGATVLEDGRIAIYYGANTEESKWTVNADGRLAVSADGLSFTDQGVVLNHRDRSVWGFGDELFPIIAFHDDGTWYLYYIPNGCPQSGELGVVWGRQGEDSIQCEAAVSEGKKVKVWGMGGYAKIGSDTYALFLNNTRKRQMEVRAVHLDSPERLSRVIRRYGFDHFAQGTVLLDDARNTWYMYYRKPTHEGYHLRIAPVRRISDNGG